MDPIILDVRESDEFEGEHIEGSVHVPLSRFSLSAPGILKHLEGRQIFIMCRGGTRAKLAQAQLDQLGFSQSLSAKVYEGGLTEWKNQGKPVIGKKTSRLPIMR